MHESDWSSSDSISEDEETAAAANNKDAVQEDTKKGAHTSVRMDFEKRRVLLAQIERYKGFLTRYRRERNKDRKRRLGEELAGFRQAQEQIAT